MLRYARAASTRVYAVEVSGWDDAQNFFVENCDLVWNEEGVKHVALHRELNESTILFVRLTDAGDSQRAHPVVYEACLVGELPNRRYEFQLNMVAPRLRG